MIKDGIDDFHVRDNPSKKIWESNSVEGMMYSLSFHVLIVIKQK